MALDFDGMGHAFSGQQDGTVLVAPRQSAADEAPWAISFAGGAAAIKQSVMTEAGA